MAIPTLGHEAFQHHIAGEPVLACHRLLLTPLSREISRLSWRSVLSKDQNEIRQAEKVRHKAAAEIGRTPKAEVAGSSSTTSRPFKCLEPDRFRVAQCKRSAGWPGHFVRTRCQRPMFRSIGSRYRRWNYMSRTK